MTEPLVGVIMGSRSDWETMRHAAETLEELQVPFESRVVSAHRTPDLLAEYAGSAQGRVRMGRRRDDGPVDAVQEVMSEDRPAGQRQRLVEEGPSLCGFAAGEVDLGQPLQRMRFAEGGVELVVQRGGIAQLAFGRVEVP